MSRWKTIDRDIYNAGGSIIATCFGIRPEDRRLEIVLNDPNTFHKLVCDGLSSFSIQWAYWDSDIADDRLYWFPSDDPDGKGTYSQFDLNGGYQFGVYFNVPVSTTTINDWHAIEDGQVVFKNTGAQFGADFFPKAIKFTFKIYDSKGIIANGQKFTHIVYLDE